MNLLRPCPLSKRPTRLLAILASALLAPLALFADSLQWLESSKHFDAQFDDETIEAAYPFTNTSESTVTILGASASCGCTIPTLDKKVYAPGEGGELTAVFKIGSRQGKQRKTITVETENEEGESESYDLKLEVDIPIPVTFKPRFRFWKLNSAPITQDIEVKFHEAIPTAITGLKDRDNGSPTNFDFKIETITENLHYVIKITPKSTAQKARDVFFLQTDDEGNETLGKHPIYAYIR